MATMALAPRCSASWTIRAMTSCRLSQSMRVISGSSPPPSDRKPAITWPPISRARTVKPITSPKTASILWPGMSLDVTISMT